MIKILLLEKRYPLTRVLFFALTTKHIFVVITNYLIHTTNLATKEVRSIAITQDSRGRIVVDGYTLTFKQARFCEEYVSNGNVINEAVIKAGYSKSSPSVVNSMGLENLNKPACKAYIAELQQRFKQTADHRVATIEERRNLLTQWIYSDDVRYNDKLKALDILNKMDAAYEQRIKMDTTINNPVQSLTTEELRSLIDNKPD